MFNLSGRTLCLCHQTTTPNLQSSPRGASYCTLLHSGFISLSQYLKSANIVLQKQPALKLLSPPLLHLPLSFPPQSSHRLTTWCTLTINIPSLLPYFLSASLTREGVRSDSDDLRASDDPHSHSITPQIPSGTYSHVSYVKVYATCRLRRIWFTDAGASQPLPSEFELYSAN